MKVLVACEFSGVVRDAFSARGHEAWSCDLLPSETPGNHFTGPLDIFLTKRSAPVFDLMIAHPPCTHLAVSGSRWFKEKAEVQGFAVAFAWWLLESSFVNIPRRAIENPVGILSSRLRKPDQIIQPHEFGHPEFKKTCLWLRNLPRLVPTKKLNVPKKGTPEWKAWNKVHRMTPGANRWKERSRFYPGIAEAMATQWTQTQEAA